MRKSLHIARHGVAVTVLALPIAIGMWSLAPATWGGAAPQSGESEYSPVQSIAYTFGSKFMSGYFTTEESHCLARLMVIERADPDKQEKSIPASAMRIRFDMKPGEVVGLDSEEGHSLNLTCGQDARLMRVITGEREKLTTLQKQALQPDVTASR